MSIINSFPFREVGVVFTLSNSNWVKFSRLPQL